MGGDAQHGPSRERATGVETWPTLPKEEVARRLVARIGPALLEGSRAVSLPVGRQAPAARPRPAAAALRDRGRRRARPRRRQSGRRADRRFAPGGRVLVPTGLVIALPAGYEAQVRPRSGPRLAARGHGPQRAGHDRRGLSAARSSVLLVECRAGCRSRSRGECGSRSSSSRRSRRVSLFEAGDVDGTARCGRRLRLDRSSAGGERSR